MPPIDIEKAIRVFVNLCMIDIIHECNANNPNFKIDDFDVVPMWTQLAKYSNDSNVTAPTNYLGFNGTWSLEITEPFYRWQHKITGQGWLLKP